MTRDGFALLAMGFTGKEALAWKIAFIKAFNGLESQVHEDNARLRNENQSLAQTQRALPKPKREKRQRVPVIHGDLLGGITLNFQVMARSELVEWQKAIAQVPTMAHIRDRFEESIRERVDIAVLTLRQHLGPIGIDTEEAEKNLRQAMAIMCLPRHQAH
jgi:UDP-2,3-diacylglucosamine pyrophosphatase LpxH